MTNNVKDVEISAFAKHAMLEYAKEVVCNRAIPDYRDGLKPVQRVILWQSYLSKLRPTAKHMKLAKLSGLCMTFHPHGDGSIDNAAMNMSESWSRRTPFIDIHGNNGSIDGSRGAASRYVEARMAPAAELLFDGIKENAVDLVDNYDATELWPVILPASYPVLLANGASGIGVGLSTSILPHNPAELMDLMILELKDQLTVASAADVYHGPDFPTGGIVTGDPLQELTSPTASYKVYASVKVEGHKIIIRGVPFGVTSTSMIESIISRIKGLDVQYVNDVLDLTENDDVKVVVDCKRRTDKAKLDALATLIRDRTNASCTISASNICIIDNQPQSVTVIDYIKAFTKFRLATKKRVNQHKLETAIKRVEIINSELFAANNLDVIKQLLDDSNNAEEMINVLVNDYKLTREQAEHITRLRLTSLIRKSKEAQQLLTELDQVKADIKLYTELVKSTVAARKQLIEESQQIRQKLASWFPRQTTFADESEFSHEASVSAMESKAAAEPVVIEATADSVAIRKRASDDTDCIRFECMSNDTILIFTTKGHLLRTQPDLIETDQQGRLVAAGISGDEQIIGACMYDPDLKLISVTKHGYIKHSSIDKCLPGKITRANQRRAHTYNSCEGARVRKAGLDDEVIYLAVNKTGKEPRNLQLNQPANKRKPETMVDTDWLLERNDGGGSAGTCVAWSHDGKHVITSVVAS